jgi:hypothetical protein
MLLPFCLNIPNGKSAYRSLEKVLTHLLEKLLTIKWKKSLPHQLKKSLPRTN